MIFVLCLDFYIIVMNSVSQIHDDWVACIYLFRHNSCTVDRLVIESFHLLYSLPLCVRFMRFSGCFMTFSVFFTVKKMKEE